MLTNNFYKILLAHMTRNSASANCVKPDGQDASVSSPQIVMNALGYVRSAPFAAGNYGTYFGTGTTPPTMKDYNLESPIMDGTLASSNAGNAMFGFEKDHARVYRTHEVFNNGTNDVTITEVGVFGAVSSSSPILFMIDRTVLDKPITIPAGESRSITIAIVFNYPTTSYDNI